MQVCVTFLHDHHSCKKETHMAKYIAKLTNEERVKLISLVSKGKGSAKKLTHARILLAIDGSNDRARARVR